MGWNYSFGREVSTGFTETVERVRHLLSKEHFGIVSEMDVAAIIKEKIGKKMAPYIILGACNPSMAYQALQEEPSLGALLPCNVVIRQCEEGGVVVEVMDPDILDQIDQDGVRAIARDARERLSRVLDALQ